MIMKAINCCFLIYTWFVLVDFLFGHTEYFVIVFVTCALICDLRTNFEDDLLLFQIIRLSSTQQSTR